MNAAAKIITSVIEGVARAFKMTREAAADTAEEIARKVRRGDLIAEDAFAQARDDAADVRADRESLPD